MSDLSIEADDMDAALDRIKAAGFAIEYGPVDEPWGVCRFFVRDPFEKLVSAQRRPYPNEQKNSRP